MRVPINLASQPLENLRPLRTALFLCAMAALLLAAIILQRELRSRSEFRALIQQQATLERDLKNLQGERQELENWLSTPLAQQIRERSGFLNSLILRKSLSWTRMFEDLEGTLPRTARIVSIRPSLSQTQDVELNLTVAAGSMEPLVSFLKNLESSPQFGPPAVLAQHYGADNSGKAPEGISVDLTTRYQQTAAAAPGEGAESSAVSKPSADADEQASLNSAPAKEKQ